MLSGVLRSGRAVQVNIAIMRAFVQMRRFLESDKELALKVEQHDRQIELIIDAIDELMKPPTASQKRHIGFLAENDDA